MWTGSYGKEPFDLRLTVLRMIRNLHIIIGVTVLGMLLFGGGYFVKNIVLNYDIRYETTSTYKTDYMDLVYGADQYFINTMTWNTHVHSKEFLDAVWKHLQEEAEAFDSSFVSSSEELADFIEVKVDSDVLVPSVVVTASDEEWVLPIARAVEKTMVGEFAKNNKQLVDIRVLDPADTVVEVLPDVRPLRAIALSGILSFFFVVVVLLLKELADDSIWLPATLRRRYGLAPVGTANSPEGMVNLAHLLQGKRRVAVCTVSEQVNPVEVIAALENMKNDSDDATLKQCDDTMKKWIPIPAPLLCPQACGTVREAEGVLLVVKAGRGAGKSLEYVLEFLATQEIKVDAALLWDADEWLIGMYYMLNGRTKANNGKV